MQCVITESSKRKLYIFPVSNHPAVRLLEQGYTPTDKEGRKKHSSLVAKLQQDNIKQLVEKSDAEVYFYA